MNELINGLGGEDCLRLKIGEVFEMRLLILTEETKTLWDLAMGAEEGDKRCHRSVLHNPHGMLLLILTVRFLVFFFSKTMILFFLGAPVKQ